MTKKPIAEIDAVKAELRKARDEILKLDEDVEKRKNALYHAERERRLEADELRKEIKSAHERIEKMRVQNTELQVLVGKLEGYRLRVECEDGLRYGRPPMYRVSGPAGVASGPNPHYRPYSDGFFER